MTSRSAANDIWSIGATFVQMISGKQINNQDNISQFFINITQYKIVINGMPYKNFLQTLSDDDFKKKIIFRTLCKESIRASCKDLLSVVLAYLPLKLVRRISKQALINADENDPDIHGMSYNSARDELFFVDFANNVVRVMRVRDNAGDLRDVYRASHDTSLDTEIYSVCHMSDSDTLLVSLNECSAYWLVALSRNGSEWREAHRVQIDGSVHISYALSDSRVLIGEICSAKKHGGWLAGLKAGARWLKNEDSDDEDMEDMDMDYINMELFRVESGPRIARVHRIHLNKELHKCLFCATCGSDTLVALGCFQKIDENSDEDSDEDGVLKMPVFDDNSVRVHRLRGNRLEELARIRLKKPHNLMWLADRLLVADFDDEKKSDSIIELKVSDTRLKRQGELIATC